jgi:LytR cell envelope-related transcriptional attenuator
VRVLPVRPVLDRVANPDGVDLLAPDNGGQKLLMAEVLPGAISPANSNIRFRVANATGDPALLYQAASRLVFVGANVVVVSEPLDTQKETVIEYEDEIRKDEAARYLPVVGPATVRQSSERIDGIDATVILGQDFATFMQSENAKGTTTTSAAPASTAASLPASTTS